MLCCLSAACWGLCFNCSYSNGNHIDKNIIISYEESSKALASRTESTPITFAQLYDLRGIYRFKYSTEYKGLDNGYPNLIIVIPQVGATTSNYGVCVIHVLQHFHLDGAQLACHRNLSISEDACKDENGDVIIRFDRKKGKITGLFYNDKHFHKDTSYYELIKKI